MRPTVSIAIVAPNSSAPAKQIVARHSFILLCALLFSGSFAAQEQCGIEAKLLLSPEQIPTIVAKLRARRESSGEIYFFDTEKREFLSQGVIVRLRRGSWNDLTVKLRPAQGAKIAVTTSGSEIYKCEVDIVGDEPVTAYSVTNKFSREQVPDTGNDVLLALGPGQKNLLEAAHVDIDWHHVKRVADIAETDWRIRSTSRAKNLSLELWEWPGGRILELSGKAGSEEGKAAFDELRQLAVANGVKLSLDQRSKTRIVLEPR
jgi:hypothetical protein